MALGVFHIGRSYSKGEGGSQKAEKRQNQLISVNDKGGGVGLNNS